jgi:hypothetical protein
MSERAEQDQRDQVIDTGLDQSASSARRNIPHS